MQLQVGEKRHGFQMIESKKIDEINGDGHIFYHEPSGVTLIALENKDPHKVFSVNFLTLPENNKGAAHIVEHAVCCASKNYPLKETFMALGQGSVSTTMNACTYPDRTMYYIASPHEKDLLGIAEVYMDLLFQPCIDESNLYFLQEGWHYSIDDVEEPLEISGVVYHEMLGEYAEASTHLLHVEMETLFPDTVYQYDSGGIPEEIIKLSEKEFLSFYQKHYVGTNTVITLYGDLNIEQVLKVLDQKCLKAVNKGNFTGYVTTQKAFECPQYTHAYYPTVLKKAPTLLSMSFVVGDSVDTELRLALEMLEHMLIRSTASPLLRTLILEQELGQSFSEGGYDSCRKQPVFTMTLKGCNAKQALVFEESVLNVLTQLVEKGIDLKLIDAAIETLEFELRETDASYEPIGILYSEMMLSSYLYGGNAFNHLCYREALNNIKANKHKGYFEKLIERYFLKNTHRVLTVLEPNEHLQTQKENQFTEALVSYKAQLDEAALMSLIAQNEWLEEEQLKENEEAQLQTLPYLTLEDMPHVLPELKLASLDVAGCKMLYHEENTKEIIYIHFLWDAEVISEEMRQDLGLFAHLFTYIGTQSKSFSEVENKINTITGGVNCAVHAYHLKGKYVVKPVFKVSGKLLCHQLDAFIELMEEIVCYTHFKEKEKLKELIGHIVYEMERSFTGAPEYRATQRLYTYLSEQGVYEDALSGIAFYHYMKAVYEDFDNQYEKLVIRLQKVMKQLLQKENLRLCVTAPKAWQLPIVSAVKRFINALPMNQFIERQPLRLTINKGNEGFLNGQEGQAVANGFCFKEYGYRYKGQYEVIANVLENTYLWDRVRLQGGAYGCDIMLSQEGYLVVCSYCDPHIKETLAVYAGIGAYLEQLEIETATIERAIISTMGAMLAPSSMEQKSERACMYFITGMTQEERQTIYNEIRITTKEDFKEMAQLFKTMAQYGKCCIFGNAEKLKKEKNRLTLIDLNT